MAVLITGGMAVKTHFGFTSRQLPEDGWNVATCLLDAITFYPRSLELRAQAGVRLWLRTIAVQGVAPTYLSHNNHNLRRLQHGT